VTAVLNLHPVGMHRAVENATLLKILCIPPGMQPSVVKKFQLAFCFGIFYNDVCVRFPFPPH